MNMHVSTFDILSHFGTPMDFSPWITLAVGQKQFPTLNNLFIGQLYETQQ